MCIRDRDDAPDLSPGPPGPPPPMRTFDLAPAVRYRLPEPELCILLRMLCFVPLPTAMSMTTAAIPMMIPSMVRNERIFAAKIARVAFRKLSLRSILVPLIGHTAADLVTTLAFRLCHDGIAVTAVYNRLPVCVHLLHDVYDFTGALGVEVAGRLVGKNNWWIHHQGPSNSDTLLFSTRHFNRTIVHAILESNTLQQFMGTSSFVSSADHMCGIGAWKKNILQSSQLRQQVVCLKHESYVPIANTGKIIRSELGNIMVLETIRTRGRGVQTSEYMHQCRFSRTGWPHDSNKFMFADVKRYAGKSIDRNATDRVGLADVAELDQVHRLHTAWEATEAAPRVCWRCPRMCRARRTSGTRRAQDTVSRFAARGNLNILVALNACLHLCLRDRCLFVSTRRYYCHIVLTVF